MRWHQAMELEDHENDRSAAPTLVKSTLSIRTLKDCRDDGERLESVKKWNVAQVDLLYDRL